MTRALSHLGTPLRIVIGLVLLGALLVAVQQVRGEPGYHARLHQAGGLSPGDDVRIAGLRVGEVTAIEADMNEVDVTFRLTESPDGLGVTEDTATEVKLLSLLGQRFLSLTPGTADTLADGDTIEATHALDTYTMEEFWLDSIPQVEGLELDTVEQALDVLATDLEVDPEQMRNTLHGISGLAGMVEQREAQFDTLLASIGEVTDLVLDQTDAIDRTLTNGAVVLTMVHERRESLRQMLRAGHDFVVGLTALVEETAPELKPLLRRLRKVLKTFDKHRDDLDRTLELAGPTMRVFTNALGDGPWLGVNAPNAIFPDDMFCLAVPTEDCS